MTFVLLNKRQRKKMNKNLAGSDDFLPSLTYDVVKLLPQSVIDRPMTDKNYLSIPPILLLLH